MASQTAAETARLTFRNVDTTGLTAIGPRIARMTWAELDRACEDLGDGRDHVSAVYRQLRSESLPARRAADAAAERAEKVRAAKAAGLSFIAPTGAPAYIAPRDQGQIILVGYSVCELCDGGWTVVRHGFDQSDRSTVVEESDRGRGWPTIELAQAEARRMI